MLGMNNSGSPSDGVLTGTSQLNSNFMITAGLGKQGRATVPV